MKKTKFYAFMAAGLVAFSAGVTSCDEESEEDNGVKKQLSSITNVWGGWPDVNPNSYTINYENGKMSSHSTSIYTTTFTYEGDSVIHSQIIVDSLNKVIVDNTYFLNADGTVNKRVCNGDTLKYYFNSAKQLTKIDQGVYGDVYYHYNDMGCFIGTSEGDVSKIVEKYLYVNSSVKTPIKNKAHLSFYSSGVDDYTLLDIYGSTYAYLPVAVNGDAFFEAYVKIKNTFDWTLDADGYPISMKQVNHNALEEYKNESWSFTWK